MSHIHRGIALALVLGVTGSVHAAENTPPAAVTPAAPATAARIDPQALKLFRQTIAAYKGLTSYSANIEMVMNRGGSKTNTPEISSKLLFQKPGHILIRSKSAAGSGRPSQIASDGKFLYAELPNDTKNYLKQPVSGNPVQMSLQVSGLMGTLLGALIADPDTIERTFTNNPSVALTSLTLGDPGMMDGVPVDTYAAEFLIKQAGVKQTITVSVGHDDHLVRQAKMAAKSANGGKMPNGSDGISVIETHANVKANTEIPATLLSFIPPAGTTPIDHVAQPAQQAMYDPRLKPGAPPIPFSHADMSGKSISLAQFKGKVVLLDFWATWCGPCVGEMPNVIAAYSKYHAKGFNIVGVSLDQDKAALTSFIKENKMTWPQIYDGKYWNSDLARLYKVQGIPFGLLIGRDGKIVAVEARGPELAPAIEKALAQK